MEFLLLILVFLLIVIFFLAKNVIRENKRKKIIKNPFPREWENYFWETSKLISQPELFIGVAVMVPEIILGSGAWSAPI